MIAIWKQTDRIFVKYRINVQKNNTPPLKHEDIQELTLIKGHG